MPGDNKILFFIVACEPDSFRCTSGACIPKEKKCDRTPDCLDWSDEVQCPIGHCLENEMSCGAFGACVSLAWKCDGHSDCPNGADEKDCPEGMCCVIPDLPEGMCCVILDLPEGMCCVILDLSGVLIFCIMFSKIKLSMTALFNQSSSCKKYKFIF